MSRVKETFPPIYVCRYVWRHFVMIMVKDAVSRYALMFVLSALATILLLSAIIISLVTRSYWCAVVASIAFSFTMWATIWIDRVENEMRG